MDNIYTKKVLRHFKHPYNMGVIKNPDGVAEVGNRVCGDIMKIYIKIARNSKTPKLKNSKLKAQNLEYIKDIKFQTLGCAAAIATSSVVTQMVKGESIKEALKLTNDKVAKELGGLPKIKMHCSVLAVEALRKAIKDYQNNIKKVK